MDHLHDIGIDGKPLVPQLRGELAKKFGHLPINLQVAKVNGTRPKMLGNRKDRKKTDVNMPPEEISRRFWTRVDQSTGPDSCWLWMGPLSKKGYGGFSILYQKNKTLFSSAAHRFAYADHFKVKIPEGLMVCHNCDNPPCCNPSHLFLGTAKDNTQDAIKKGRHVFGKLPVNHLKGSTNPSSTLTEKKVLQIRALHATGEYRLIDLAIMFHVTQTNISYIVRRKSWTHI